MRTTKPDTYRIGEFAPVTQSAPDRLHHYERRGRAGWPTETLIPKALRRS